MLEKNGMLGKPVLEGRDRDLSKRHSGQQEKTAETERPPETKLGAWHPGRAQVPKLQNTRQTNDFM